MLSGIMWGLTQKEQMNPLPIYDNFAWEELILQLKQQLSQEGMFWGTKEVFFLLREDKSTQAQETHKSN